MAKITKILYIITQSEWGGAQRYIFDLATHLPADQFQVLVAAGNEQKHTHDGMLFQRLDQHNIAHVTLKNLVREINPRLDWRAYHEIKKIIAAFQPDIVHLNSSKVGVLGAVAAKKMGIKKIIYTAHGFVFNEPMSKIKKLFYIWAERFSAHYKNDIICVSEFDRQTALQYSIGNQSKFIAIHNGIGDLHFLPREQSRNILSIPAATLAIGTIANFYPTKGLPYLIDAAEQIIKKNNAVEFFIIGFGALESVLQEMIEQKKLTNKIHLITNQPFGARLLLAFDIYCLPSIKEGLPFAILEAMQAGLPIVATNVGGIPEMISDSVDGLLASPANSHDLAEKIDRLITNHDLAIQLGQQAHHNVVQNFSLQHMIQQTLDVYNR